MGAVRLLGSADPALDQAIATIAGALAVLILAVAQWVLARSRTRERHRHHADDED